MKTNRSQSTVAYVLTLALLLCWLFAPGPAGARPLAAPAVTDVSPNNVSNTTAVTLIISGTGFELGSIVIVEGYNTLITTFVSATVLNANLPAGVPAGVYTVTVFNSSDSMQGSLNDILTVTAPPPPPAPTAIPAATSFVRPIVKVLSYGASSEAIRPGQDFDFEITFENAGQIAAWNIVASFTPGQFMPRVTGGVRVEGPLDPGQSLRTFQPFTASTGLSGDTGSVEMLVEYTDVNGTTYSETFTLVFDLVTYVPVQPTSTPVGIERPQLIIGSYETNLETLRPGADFTLELDVRNLGTTDAQGITMILGGGSSAGGVGDASDTPGAGGVSGASGEFTTFAPLGSSNVQFIGDLSAGDSVTVSQRLVTNVSATPGAYPVTFSFTYTDDRGNSYTDDQVITLLVYAPPQVEVSFYRDLDPLIANQPNILPLQIVNLGRNSVVLGNLVVNGESAHFTNNALFIGVLNSGGFFSLDATIIPEQPGPLDLIVTVKYTDDFNEPREIVQTLAVEVIESPSMFAPGGESMGEGEFGPPSLAPETFGQKVWRFIRGMLGLGSGRRMPAGPTGMPPGESRLAPVEVEVESVPVEQVPTPLPESP